MTQMKTHDQILCDYQGEEMYGGATCPFCGVRSHLYPMKGFMMATRTCPHVNMAVSAGGLDVAVHFEIRGRRAS